MAGAAVVRQTLLPCRPAAPLQAAAGEVAGPAAVPRVAAGHPRSCSPRAELAAVAAGEAAPLLPVQHCARQLWPHIGRSDNEQKWKLGDG